MTEDIHLGPRVRELDAETLGVGYANTAASQLPASAPDTPRPNPEDPDVQEVITLLHQYSGVLLSGPPGTSKSYLARTVAQVMTGNDDNRMEFVQFHPSYQFEDFIEGYRPDPEKGFVRRDGVFLRLCKKALDDYPNPHVIVIDELSRGDAARVFGEAFTYIERSKRGKSFTLPSGKKAKIPTNVHIIATMNPLDRGVDEVDAAFGRRFATKLMEPNVEILAKRLKENGLEEELQSRVIEWFRNINGRARQNPAAALGHAYFWNITDKESLRNAWKYQIQHHVNRAFRYDEQGRDSLIAAWFAMLSLEAETE